MERLQYINIKNNKHGLYVYFRQQITKSWFSNN